MNATPIKLLLMVTALALLSSCGSIYPDDMGEPDFDFDFQAADNTEAYASLDYMLPEGSGISVDPVSGQVAIVGDEGDFLISQVNNLASEKRLSFFQQGEDMEDICHVTANRLFALRSDGRLYDMRISDTSSQGGYVLESKKTYDTPLTAENDAEGLCFDPQHKRLLIACKGPALINGKNDPAAKGIYAFDLTTMQFVEKPVFLFTKENLAEHLPGVKNPLEYVEPAGISISPINEFDFHLYVLIGSTPAILKLHYSHPIAEFAIKRYEPLDPGRYSQPEGISLISHDYLLMVDEIEKEMGDSSYPATRLHVLTKAN